MIITLLRKPLEGTVAENALQHGCGAINIDATRVEGEPWKWGTQTDLKGGGFGTKRPSEGNTLRKNVEGGFNGRWPANFILTHLDGCELRGTKNIKQGESSSAVGGSDRKVGLYKDGLKKEAENLYRGEEEVENWACVEGCPVKKLDTQTGILKSGGLNAEKSPQMPGVNRIFGSSKEMTATFGEEAGPSKFFMRFKKDPEQ
jgi:hypothetical protein